jgi:hypothetical protein
MAPEEQRRTRATNHARVGTLRRRQRRRFNDSEATRMTGADTMVCFMVGLLAEKDAD